MPKEEEGSRNFFSVDDTNGMVRVVKKTCSAVIEREFCQNSEHLLEIDYYTSYIDLIVQLRHCSCSCTYFSVRVCFTCSQLMRAGEKGSKMCMRYDYIQLNFGNILSQKM